MSELDLIEVGGSAASRRFKHLSNMRWRSMTAITSVDLRRLACVADMATAAEEMWPPPG
jgi:hypothetical protein